MPVYGLGVLLFDLFALPLFGFLFAFALIIGYKLKGQPFSRRIKRILIIVIPAIFLTISVLYYGMGYQLLVDRAFDNMSVIDVELQPLERRDRQMYSEIDGKRYYISFTIHAELEQDYVGHPCRIHYYQWSGFVTYIERLDETP